MSHCSKCNVGIIQQTSFLDPKDNESAVTAYGCNRCDHGWSEPGNKLVPVQTPTATSTRVSMEMIVGSVEKNETTGETKINRFVSFSTGDGHHILYPWESLRNTVLQWVEVEKGEPK